MFQDKFIQQAVKPRGQNANEKMQFLSQWYAKTAEIAPSDQTQRILIEHTAKYVQTLRDLIKETPESTKEAVAAFLPVVMERHNASITTGAKMFYSYLYIELDTILK